MSSPEQYKFFSLQVQIAILSIVTIILSLYFRFSGSALSPNLPLYVCYALGGVPLLYELLKKALRREFGSDLLAGISIFTSVILEEYLAGVFVILMLSGGEALEHYALRRASRVLDLLAKKLPDYAFKLVNGTAQKVAVSELKVGDLIEIHPHTTCPVDAVVAQGESLLDESFLTGEPFLLKKVKGSSIISGALNSDGMLTVEVTAPAQDSRYQKIAKVIEENSRTKVHMKRLGDSIGAWYTPLAVLIAIVAWYFSGDASRFLSVLVVATPCPLLIAIPVALIGSVSSAASRGIIIKNPAALELMPLCKAVLFDKTGTLTYGKPTLVQIRSHDSDSADQALQILASMEVYSRHPLASAVLAAARERNMELLKVENISEKPGYGLMAEINGKTYMVTSRARLSADIAVPDKIPGLECVLLCEEKYLAVFSFQDVPRSDSKEFLDHIIEDHHISRVGILSGDRFEEVADIAKSLGISEVKAGLSPEEKLAEIKIAKAAGRVIYVGDGVNDAPALQSADVGVALGHGSDISAEVADVVLLESSIGRLHEAFHLTHRFRSIALQSAVGGMAASIIGMGFASIGLLTPLAGAITQEIIDVFAVANALRAAFYKK